MRRVKLIPSYAINPALPPSSQPNSQPTHSKFEPLSLFNHRARIPSASRTLSLVFCKLFDIPRSHVPPTWSDSDSDSDSDFDLTGLEVRTFHKYG